MNDATSGAGAPQDAGANKAHLIRRLIEVDSAPSEIFSGEKTAKEFIEQLVEHTGLARRSGSEEPDWRGRAEAIRHAFSSRYRETRDADDAYGAALAVLREQVGHRPAVAADRLEAAMPKRLVSLSDEKEKNWNGAVLSVGTVCLLSGEGGMSKTTLALQMGLQAAARHVADDLWRSEEERKWCAGLHCRAGPVLFASYEDPLSVCRWRLDRLIRTLKGNEASAAQSGLAHFHFMDMTNRPLYGPPAGFGYNHRPEPLEGWWDLTTAVKAVQPVLVVVDPALGAYVGEPNAPAAVREFLSALARLGGEHGAGVLLLAHSTKAARRSADKFDPGHIGGSAAWHDGVRGALLLARGGPAARELRVSKANYGPAYMEMILDPIAGRDARGRKTGPVAFREGSTWEENPGGDNSQAGGPADPEEENGLSNGRQEIDSMVGKPDSGKGNGGDPPGVNF